ncbi:hypothetical protein RFF05_14700 [Bengtsoniella intestinalis]|uniref:hypothetical protein n=1 Tax=Bengtsoniella intestinalis TaxID=3073143 RepID=UPI00391F46B9
MDFNSGFIPEEEKEKYIDFKSIGKVVQKNDNGIFTKYGYFFYDGENEDIIRMCDELKTDKPM